MIARLVGIVERVAGRGDEIHLAGSTGSLIQAARISGLRGRRWKWEDGICGVGVVVVLPNKGVDDEAILFSLCLFVALLYQGPKS